MATRSNITVSLDALQEFDHLLYYDHSNRTIQNLGEMTVDGGAKGIETGDSPLKSLFTKLSVRCVTEQLVTLRNSEMLYMTHLFGAKDCDHDTVWSASSLTSPGEDNGGEDNRYSCDLLTIR